VNALAEQGSGKIRQPTVLVVEDEFLVRNMITNELRAAGLHVLEAGDVDVALRTLYGPDRVDLVMTDVRMPGSKDGLALAEAIRTHWPDLKIVVTSGDVRAVPSEIADDFFVKPYGLDTVVRRIKALLGLGR
jgi:DNA-binding response OmpR family regulator